MFLLGLLVVLINAELVLCNVTQIINVEAALLKLWSKSRLAVVDLISKDLAAKFSSGSTSTCSDTLVLLITNNKEVELDDSPVVLDDVKEVIIHQFVDLEWRDDLLQSRNAVNMHFNLVLVLHHRAGAHENVVVVHFKTLSFFNLINQIFLQYYQ